MVSRPSPSRGSLLLAAVLLATLAPAAVAEPVDQVLPFEREIRGLVVPGRNSLRFSLHDAATGGSRVWSETKTLALRTARVRTFLGDATPTALEGVDFSRQLWVQVALLRRGRYRVIGRRTPLRASPYAFWSPRTGAIAGGVTAPMIQPGAVTSAAIADGAATGPAIAAGAVGNARLATGAVTAGKLSDWAVTTDRIADDSLTAADVGNLTVGAAHVAPGQLRLRHIAFAPHDVGGVSSFSATEETLLLGLTYQVCFLSLVEFTEGSTNGTWQGCEVRRGPSGWELVARGGSVSAVCRAMCLY